MDEAVFKTKYLAKSKISAKSLDLLKNRKLKKHIVIDSDDEKTVKISSKKTKPLSLQEKWKEALTPILDLLASLNYCVEDIQACHETDTTVVYDYGNYYYLVAIGFKNPKYYTIAPDCVMLCDDPDDGFIVIEDANVYAYLAAYVP